MSQGQKASETWYWPSDAVAMHPDGPGISSSLFTPGDCRTAPLPVSVSSLIKNVVPLRSKDASSSEVSMAVSSPGDSVPSTAQSTTEGPHPRGPLQSYILTPHGIKQQGQYLYHSLIQGCVRTVFASRRCLRGLSHQVSTSSRFCGQPGHEHCKTMTQTTDTIPNRINKT